MFRWKKLGKVFCPQDVRDRPWLKEFAQAPSVLVCPGFLRVYFSGRPAADSNGQYVSYCGYVDLDRTDPFKVLNVSKTPILELGGVGHFDEFGTYPVSVVRWEGEVRAYYGGWTRCESVPFNVAIGLAISHDDGTTFEKVGAGPILSYSVDEPFVLSGPKIRRFHDTWYLWYIAGRKWKLVDGRPEPVYKIRMATSTDGLRWAKVNRDLIESRIEPDEAQASPDVFYCDSRYHMLFCYRYSAHFRGKQRGYRIGYATSSDLLNWSRDDTQAGIDVSEDGWDAEMVSYPHVFDLDGKTYLAYLGNEVGRYGFGFAERQ